MRCRNCGHENPQDNRFCGMCGNLLVGRPLEEAEYAARKTPVASHQEARSLEESVAAPVEIRREPVEARLEHAEVRDPAARQPIPKSEKWWVDEGETTVGGPSFLGLSSADTSGGGGGGYSYLFQEEEERSHKAAWVFLLVLLVLGGVVYAKWQPIRDYVLTTALMHARPTQPPAAQDNSAQPTAPAGSAPTTTVASSDTQPPPPITETNKAEAAQAGDQKAADPKEGLPGANKQPAGDSSKRAKQPESQPSAAADKPSADEEETSADEEKPSPDKKASGAQAGDGGELVDHGERYLYGRGVPRSCHQAVSYFNAAAAKQNPQAFSHLGALYATGECVPMDRAVAYAWFRRAYAKEPTNHYFEQNLTMLWREMSPDEKQRATGRQ